MNLVKCANGHFYDTERYGSCPHCAGAGADAVTVPMMRPGAGEDVTVAVNQGAASAVTEALGHQPTPPSPPGSLQDAVKAASTSAVNAPVANEEKTVGFFSKAIGLEPVVGWLVCTVGEHFGEDFKLKSGRNYIGRAASMDVAITKDGTVSRERHAAIVYEPRGNLFIVQPGDSKELSYLNGEVVLSPLELKKGGRLSVGQTELMFVPCCDKDFKWEA